VCPSIFFFFFSSSFSSSFWCILVEDTDTIF
jgi:hypothetical protein